MNTVEIVYASNQAFLPILGVSLYSLIQHTNSERHYRVTILEEGMPEACQTEILAMQRPHIEIRFVDVHPWMEQYEIPADAHLSRETAHRLVVDKIFLEQEKVLYLDADTLIFSDVAELFDEELGDAVLGASIELTYLNYARYLQSELGLHVAEYFNSGVLLIHLEQFREQHIGKRALDLIDANHFPCPDQDALNILCKGRVHFIDTHWNVVWHHICHSEEELYVGGEGYKKMAAAADPYILHYTTDRKPWLYPEYPLADLWWKAARASGFAGEAAEFARAKIAQDMNPFKRFVFPWQLVNPGERIILYGGGVVGQAYCQQLSLTQFAEVLAVIDQHPDTVMGINVPVLQTEEWVSSKKWNGERIVIAIEKPDMAESIRKTLTAAGVDAAKILWASPARKAEGSLL